MQRVFLRLSICSLLGLLFIALSGCITLDMQEIDSLTENELFNRAQLMQQGAINTQQYENTIELYQIYIDKFSEQKARVMEARYEIGYINFYLGRNDEAETIFRNILEDFKDGADQYAPQWIKVLSTNLKEKIQKIRTDRILEESEKQQRREERRKKLKRDKPSEDQE